MSVGHYTQPVRREPKRKVQTRSSAHNAIKAAALHYLSIDSQLRVMPETASSNRYDQLIAARDTAAATLGVEIGKLGA